MRALAASGALPVRPRPARRGARRARAGALRAWPTSIASGWCRRSIASGRRRSRRSRATCAAGCGTWPPTSAWEPRYFELSFGLPLGPEQRDPRSDPNPVLHRRALPAARRHRRHRRAPADAGAARDRPQDRQGPHEGHAGDRRRQRAAAARLRGRRRERMLGVPVGESRLFFCTSAGGFKQRPVLLDPGAEAAGDRGAGDDRSRGRARRAGAGAGRGRVHLVRLPAGVRPAARSSASARKPQAHLDDLIVAEEPAVTAPVGSRSIAS